MLAVFNVLLLTVIILTVWFHDHQIVYYNYLLLQLPEDGRFVPGGDDDTTRHRGDAAHVGRICMMANQIAAQLSCTYAAHLHFFKMLFCSELANLIGKINGFFKRMPA